MNLGLFGSILPTLTIYTTFHLESVYLVLTEKVELLSVSVEESPSIDFIKRRIRLTYREDVHGAIISTLLECHEMKDDDLQIIQKLVSTMGEEVQSRKFSGVKIEEIILSYDSMIGHIAVEFSFDNFELITNQ